jgi:hypothetical protein
LYFRELAANLLRRGRELAGCPRSGSLYSPLRGVGAKYSPWVSRLHDGSLNIVLDLVSEPVVGQNQFGKRGLGSEGDWRVGKEEERKDVKCKKKGRN